MSLSLVLVLIVLPTRIAGKSSSDDKTEGDLNERNLILEIVEEQMKHVCVCVCQTLLYVGQSLSLLKRCLQCWAWLVYRKCSKKTVAEGVGSLMSLLFSDKKKPDLSEVAMIVFVNQMLLMIAGDVEPNPGPSKQLLQITDTFCSHLFIYLPDLLTPDDLATLVNELNKVRDKWYHLGVQLNMKTSDLNAIRSQYMNNPDDSLLEMLSVWLSRTDPSPPSWQRVVDALSSPAVERPDVARHITKSYLRHETTSDPALVKKLSIKEIESRMEVLENEFEALKDDVYESVKTQPVDVFKVRLTSFKIKDKECHMDYMKKMIHQKITVTDIWVELNQYFNFLNHTILQHILTKFKNRHLQKRMDEYRDKLFSFFQYTRLCDFLQCWPIIEQDCPTKELKEFVVKCQKDWETCTLVDLDNLKGKLATKLLLPNFVFILSKASRGCLEITFSIPPPLMERLSSAIKATDLKEFVNMEIESITVDGVVCYEAPLLQYTTVLKQLYTSRSLLQPLSASKPKPLLPFRLARIEKQSLSPSDMDRFTRESLRGDMDDVVYKKMAMELSELGEMGDGSQPQVVLIEGAPGVGKTTFAWHQCQQWAKGKLLQAYSIVLLLPLRDNNIRQISSLPGLFRHSRGQVREEVSRRVAESGGAGCLIWLEAWDELPADLRSHSLFTELIRGIQLPAATIFITSRPWATGGLLETVGDRLSQRTELLALAKEEVGNEIRKMIVAIHSQTSSDSGFDFLEFIESNPMICAAIYTPVSAAIVEQVFKSAPHNPPTTVTGLYSAYVLMRLEQHLSEHPGYSDMNIRVRTLADLPERVLGDLQQLCHLAYEGVSQQVIVFSSLPEGVSTLGLLQTVPQVYDEGEDRVSYNFLHYTIQEYLAALHLSHLQPQQLINIFETKCKNMVKARFGGKYYEMTQWNTTFQFLAGITKLEPFQVPLLSDLLWLDQTNMHKWLYESQNQPLLISVQGSGDSNLRLSYSATTTDCFAAGYCLAHSNCRWKMILSSVDDVSMEFLSKGCNYQIPKNGICSQLVSASFSHGSITAKVLGYFLTIPNSLVQHIQHLDFKCSKLGRRGCELLAEGVQRMPSLETLNLSRNSGIGCGGAVQLISSLHSLKLRELNMTGTGISDPDFECLASYIHSTTSLEQLWIGKNEISVESIDSLCKALSANSSMRGLYLWELHLTTCHCVCFGQLLRQPTHCQIQKSVLGWCSLTSDGVGELMSGLSYNHTLRDLDLRNNQIGSEGAVAIATMLKTNRSLESLNIARCGIGSSGGVELGAALERNKTLRYLNLSWNAVGDDGVKGLCVGLKNNSSLEELWLWDDESLGEEGVSLLLKCLEEKNTSLNKLVLSEKFKRDTSSESTLWW